VAATFLVQVDAHAAEKTRAASASTERRPRDRSRRLRAPRIGHLRSLTARIMAHLS
jgi:hypothetical protein